MTAERDRVHRLEALLCVTARNPERAGMFLHCAMKDTATDYRTLCSCVLFICLFPSHANDFPSNSGEFWKFLDFPLTKAQSSGYTQHMERITGLSWGRRPVRDDLPAMCLSLNQDVITRSRLSLFLCLLHLRCCCYAGRSITYVHAA